MKSPTVLTGLLAVCLTAAPCALAQDFGNTETQLRDVTTAELYKPTIPDIEVGDPDPDVAIDPNDRPITVSTVPRPVYLVMRYYSCRPWFPRYVKDVFTSAVAKSAYQVIIDTGGANSETDSTEAQIVTNINHPAYGLYCIRIVVAIPWDVWQAGPCRRFYIRWAYGAPYYCWLDHWWYYWRRPCFSFPLTPGQEVQTPPVVSQATGTATICRTGASTFVYTVSYQNLTTPLTASHIHAPAAAGVNAPVVVDFAPPTGATSGTFSGTFTATAATAQNLAQGQAYVNLHTQQYPAGELRGQIPPIPTTTGRIWCPWGPSWWPWLRWNRIYDTWGLTIAHPYAYPSHPSYIPRPFCLYGLQHFFTPLGATALAVRSPAQDANSEYAPPLNDRLDMASLEARPIDPNNPERQWTIYKSVLVGGQPLRPIYRYWPYSPYCSRWYWWRPTPFITYRYNPPVVRFGLWQGATPTADFPDRPITEFPGTIGCFSSRGMVVIPADVNGDGFVNVADRAHDRAEANTRGIDSFFDVFPELPPR